jgi:hypothetical protein
MNLASEGCFGSGTMTITLDDGEDLQSHVLQHAVNKAIGDGCWNVTLIIAPDMASREGKTLLDFGFRVAGTVSEGTVTKLKLMKQLRRSPDGSPSIDERLAILATDTPRLAPTDFERGAIANAPKLKVY